MEARRRRGARDAETGRNAISRAGASPGATSTDRWVGVVDLLQDAVVHGASAVERVHRAVAHRPFAAIALFPPLAGASRVIDFAQDSFTAFVYAAVRGTSLAACALARVALRLKALRRRRATGASPRR